MRIDDGFRWRSTHPTGCAIGSALSCECSHNARAARPYAPRTIVPGLDPRSAALLGRSWLRHPAALRHGNGRRHLSPGDDPARARAEAVERRLCAAVAPAQGRPLWREPQPAATLLPVSGDPQTVAAVLGPAR